MLDLVLEKDGPSIRTAAREGSQAALEKLIQQHQDWIDNIALRMVGNPDDSELIIDSFMSFL